MYDWKARPSVHAAPFFQAKKKTKNYKVEGVDKITGSDLETNIEAESEEDACNIASKRNMLVTSIAARSMSRPIADYFLPPKILVQTREQEEARKCYEEQLRITRVAEETHRAEVLAEMRVEAADSVNTYLMLRQIAENTANTAFWMRFWSIVALIGFAISFIIALIALDRR